jgi:hypothetical protein
VKGKEELNYFRELFLDLVVRKKNGSKKNVQKGIMSEKEQENTLFE